MGNVAKDGLVSEVRKTNLIGRWAELTWNDLGQWAGSRSVTRGKQYQRWGKVKRLAVTAEAKLLADVAGSSLYVCSVWIKNARKSAITLDSKCTCPVGSSGCKHAVAVVTEFLNRISEDKPVPGAADDDPRWAKLNAPTIDADSDADEESDDLDEDFDSDDDDDDSETMGVFDIDDGKMKLSRMSKGDAKSPKKPRDKIRSFVESKSQEELVNLVCSLAESFGDVADELLEQVALTDGDEGRLVKEARKELSRIVADASRQGSWDEDGSSADYSKLQRRLEHMVKLGHFDAVARLGGEILKRGMEQLGESSDEWDTSFSLGECLAVVFQAVAKSSMPASEKILYAIAAGIDDDFGVIGDITDVILKAKHAPAVWSAVADALAKQLKSSAVDESRTYGNIRRNTLSGWLATALEKAGRSDESIAMYENEARLTGSYERLVELLIERNRVDDALKWAQEGIEKTLDKMPGIATNLARASSELAKKRKQWDVAAAHTAWQFFSQPSSVTFRELMNESAKAGCQEQVRAHALNFLETGVLPFKLSQKMPRANKLEISKDWPLPVPDFLLPFVQSREKKINRLEPEIGVLIDIAIEENRPNDALKWYDHAKVAGKQRLSSPWHYEGSSRGDRVAAAVTESHPRRALEIFGKGLEENLKHAHVAAYQNAARYLRHMRPAFKAMGKPEAWTQVVLDVRQKYKNRPKFLEILDELDDRAIVQRRG